MKKDKLTNIIPNRISTEAALRSASDSSILNGCLQF